jgi:hypothetical protein
MIPIVTPKAELDSSSFFFSAFRAQILMRDQYLLGGEVQDILTEAMDAYDKVECRLKDYATVRAISMLLSVKMLRF